MTWTQSAFTGCLCMISSLGTSWAVDAYYDARHQAAAAPLCAKVSAYPIANARNLVICEGAGPNGGRALSVVRVAQ